MPSADPSLADKPTNRIFQQRYIQIVAFFRIVCGEQKMALDRKQVFLTGGTGYMGSRLAALLLSRGHYVKVLTRITSNLMQKLPKPHVG